MVNVEFTTDGLFFTLGKMMPPLRDNGFVALALVGMAFAWIGPAPAPAFGNKLTIVAGVVLDVDDDDDDDVNGADDADAKVVVGNGKSVNSSTKEYLRKVQLKHLTLREIEMIFSQKELTCSGRIRQVDQWLDPIVIQRVRAVVPMWPHRLPVSSIASPPYPNC